MSLMEHAASCTMFSGMTDDEIEQIIQCTGAAVCKYDSGEFVKKPGGKFRRVGIILSGSVTAAWIDGSGNKFILASVEKGGVFGLSAAVAAKGDLIKKPPETYIYASENSEILMMDADRMLCECEKHCTAHRKLVYNALLEVSTKNISLVWKTCHMSQRTMRKKLASYLAVNEEMRGQPFKIPMNRQELADYLGVDRSAMCAELSRMKKDGLIDYSKNEFTIKNLTII